MQQGNQLNVEYWFRLFYDCIHGGCYGSVTGITGFLVHLWLWIIGIGYALSVVGLFVIVYCTVQLFELRHREDEYYRTLIPASDVKTDTHPRWERIMALVDGSSSSEWREAIIEADIMLDDVLTRQGYVGANVSEKLQSADKLTFTTLQDAWEAHKVRNQIAHQGSAFALSADLVRRTIGRYENVFKEFKAV